MEGRGLDNIFRGLDYLSNFTDVNVCIFGPSIDTHIVSLVVYLRIYAPSPNLQVTSSTRVSTSTLAVAHSSTFSNPPSKDHPQKTFASSNWTISRVAMPRRLARSSQGSSWSRPIFPIICANRFGFPTLLTTHPPTSTTTSISTAPIL